MLEAVAADLAREKEENVTAPLTEEEARDF